MISKIIGNIYETHDYDSFKKLLGNRDVKNVDNIKKSISDVGQLVVPIIVNEKMETNIEGLFSCGNVVGGLLQVCKAVYEGVEAGLSAVNYIKN